MPWSLALWFVCRERPVKPDSATATGLTLRHRGDTQIKIRNKKSRQASDYSTSLSLSLSLSLTHTHTHAHISVKEQLAVVPNLSGSGTIIKSSTL